MADAIAEVHSQAEYDALRRAALYAPSALVQIDAPPSPPLVIAPLRHPDTRNFRLVGRSGVLAAGPHNGGTYDVWGSAALEAHGPNHVHVGAAGQARVIDAFVDAEQQAQVWVQRCRVQARDRAKIECGDELAQPHASTVEAAHQVALLLRGKARAQVAERVTVDAFDEALVEPGSGPFYGVIRLHDRAVCRWSGGVGTLGGSDRFTLEARDDARADLSTTAGELTVAGRGRAHLVIRGGQALVTVTEDATADVSTGARVEARGRSRVTARGSAKVKLYDQATCDPQGWDVLVQDQRAAGASR